MVRYNSANQISIEEFTTPFQQKLRPENRWIKLSNIIPWDSLASIYYKTMSNDFGRPGIDARRVIGAMIIKHKLNLSDEETVLQTQENPYLQYFLGYATYEEETVFAPSLFVDIRKRIGADRFDEMNLAIIETAFIMKKKNVNSRNGTNGKGAAPEGDESKQDSGETPNNGKLIMDATVAEQAIKYPNDLELLNDSRIISEGLIDKLYKLSGLKSKPRTYRRRARKEFLSEAKKKRKSQKVLRRAIGKQLGYVSRNLKQIENMLDMNGNRRFPLSSKDQRRYWIIQEIYRQQKQMYDEKNHSCSDRIVSISQPHVRPIIRGKANKKTEFGAKIGVSLTEGFARVDTISWNAYNESSDLIKQVQNYYDHFGSYPETVIVDNIYGTQKNRKYLKSKGIRFSGKALGRPRKQTEENKEEMRKEKQKRKKEYRERIPIEGKFGQGKNGYSLNYIRAKLQATSESWISCIFLVMNIVKLSVEKINSLFYYASKTQKSILKRFFDLILCIYHEKNMIFN